MKGNKKAWMNVIGAMVVLASVYGCVINSFTLFVVPISNERGIPREYVSLILTIMFLSYMVSSSLSGRVYEKVRLKTAMVVSAVLVPTFYFLLSFPLPLFLMYALSLFIGLLLPFISFTAFSILIRSWFPDNTGFATGIAFMGSGIGGMIWSVLLGRIMENRGYQAAYATAGLIMFSIAIIVAIFFIDDSKVVMEKRGKNQKFLKPQGLYRALVLSFLVGVTPLFVSQAMVPKALDSGLGGTYASALNASFMAGLCIMKVVMGRSYDKFGLKKTLSFGLISGFIAAVLTLFITRKELFVVYIFFLSTNGTIQSMAPSLLAKKITDENNYTTTNGLCVAVNYLGCAISPLILNVVYERVGSYNPVLLTDLGLIIITTLILIMPRKLRQSKTL